MILPLQLYNLFGIVWSFSSQLPQDSMIFDDNAAQLTPLNVILKLQKCFAQVNWSNSIPKTTLHAFMVVE